MKRVGPHQGLDPGGDVVPLGARGDAESTITGDPSSVRLGAWGDELAGRVGRDGVGCGGAGDHCSLLGEDLDDAVGPGGVAPGGVLLEASVDAGPAGLPQRGGCGSGAPSPLRLGSASCVVGWRLACCDAPRLARSSLNPRARTSGRRARGLSDVLGGYPAISRTAAPGAAAPRTPRRAFRPRERRSDRRGPAQRKWSAQENATMS